MECHLQQVEAPPSFDFLSTYKKLFAIEGLHPATERVRELVIDSSVPGVQANPCLGRAYMADLLDALATQQPAAVAIDKYYPPHSCDAFPGGTRALQASVARFPWPLIVGQSSSLAETDDRYGCLCQADGLTLDGPQVRPGILRLSEQALEVPLRWYIRIQDRTGAQALPPKDSYGLAFATALAIRPELEQRLGKQLQSESLEHPYADLWGNREIVRETTADFLCNAASPTVRARWRLQCDSTAEPENLRGQVVVVGAEDPTDDKIVLGETLSGQDLHARYIAALLGDAYLREWTLVVEVAVASLLLLLTEGAVLMFDIDKRLPTLSQMKHWRTCLVGTGQGMPTMLFVLLLCDGVFVAGALALQRGFLPPIGLMATTVLLLLNDLRQYVFLKWRTTEQHAH